MAEKLNKIWAKSEPLDAYFDRLIEMEEIDLSEYEEAKRSARESLEPGSVRLNYGLIAAESKREHLFRMRRNKVKSQIERELVSGELSLIGKLTEAGTRYGIAIPPPDFWVFAKLDPEINRARCDEALFEELHVVGAQVDIEQGTKTDAERAIVSQLPSPSKHPQPAGATSQDSFRERVIEACFEKHSDFDEWSFEEKQQACINVARELKPTRDWSKRFFGRSSIYATLRRLRESEKIPSKNVQ